MVIFCGLSILLYTCSNSTIQTDRQNSIIKQGRRCAYMNMSDHPIDTHKFYHCPPPARIYQHPLHAMCGVLRVWPRRSRPMYDSKYVWLTWRPIHAIEICTLCIEMSLNTVCCSWWWWWFPSYGRVEHHMHVVRIHFLLATLNML